MSSAYITDDFDWPPTDQPLNSFRPKAAPSRATLKSSDPTPIIVQQSVCGKSGVYDEIHQCLIRMLGYFSGGQDGFCFAGPTTLERLLGGTLVRGGVASPLEGFSAEALAEVLETGRGMRPFARRILIRRAHHLLPTLRPDSVEEVSALVCPLSQDRKLHGVVATFIPQENEFDPTPDKVQGWSEALNLLLSSFAERVNLIRLIGATTHVGHFDGVCAVIDLDRSEIVWVGSRRSHSALRAAVVNAETEIAEFVRGHCGLSVEAPYCPSIELSGGRLAHVSSAQQLSAFGEGRYSVVGIRPARQEDSDVRGVLSQREEQVAQLLAEGYTVLNAAAITGLSENTVKTYVRRVYKKLQVTSRADLVKKLFVVGDAPTC